MKLQAIFQIKNRIYIKNIKNYEIYLLAIIYLFVLLIIRVLLNLRDFVV